jgi:bifunctional oligoribonuclease and PAP phosphatase NrnA
MNMELYTIVELLENSKKVVIMGHTNPDGDAVNACFALAYALEKRGITPYVLLEEYNAKYDVVDCTRFVYKGELSELSHDLVVSVDTGSLDRIGVGTELYVNSPISINIDHHISNTFYGKYNYVITTAASTCEIIYDIVIKLTDLDINIASIIYAGIVFDTGGFRHSTTNSNTFNIAANLISFGIPFNKIYTDLLLYKTRVEVNIFNTSIQKMAFINKIAYTSLTLQDFKNANASSQDLDGVVDYLLNIKGVEVVVFAYEKNDGKVKISFRAKNLDVSKIAQSFGGGGHKLAAGCTIDGALEISLKSILNKVEIELGKNGF